MSMFLELDIPIRRSYTYSHREGRAQHNMVAASPSRP